MSWRRASRSPLRPEAPTPLKAAQSPAARSHGWCWENEGGILLDEFSAIVLAVNKTFWKIATYGRSGTANDHPLDGDTVFEIGSITKVFTALLLAAMVTRGEVALDDPVAKYLPDSVKMPTRSGKQTQLTTLDFT
jgi:hypothetical protein